MKVFLISDTHFGDDRILRYENRPFASVEEMDKAIIENWNSMVSKEDTVFHLGDVSSYEPERISEILAALNGKKVLIMGNHDQNYTNKQWEEMGFEQAINYPILFREFFILSHAPMYICTNMPYANFYGHIHANPSYRDVSRQSACVCVERIGYTPIEADELITKMRRVSECSH